jgi:hypothetical protein
LYKRQEEHREEVDKAFRTFFYGNFGDYEQYTKALSLIDDEDKKKEFIKHNEDRRSSMSRIVARALQL